MQHLHPAKPRTADLNPYEAPAHQQNLNPLNSFLTGKMRKREMEKRLIEFSFSANRISPPYFVLSRFRGEKRVRSAGRACELSAPGRDALP
jgi:hypothetical protein